MDGKVVFIISCKYLKSSNLSIKSSEKKFFDLEEEEINLINAYNKKRLYILKNNIEEAIKKDLSDNRTVFLEKKLYTYAEIYLYSN